MTTSDLLDWAASKGIRLSVNGDKLHVDAPKGILTDGLKAILKARKPELLPILQRRGPSGTTTTATLNPPVPSWVKPLGATPPEAQWLTDTEAGSLPEFLQGLVIRRESWTAVGWASYLQYKARACEAMYPELAARYVQAVTLLCGGSGKPLG